MKIELTDDEIDSLRDAAFDSFGDNPDGLHNLVESIVAARVAKALRDVAKRLLGQEGHDIAFNKAKQDLTPMGRTAHWLRARADEYDPEGSK